MQTTTRTGSHKTKVIAYLRKLDSEPLKSSGVAHIRTCVRGSLDKVGGGDELLTCEFCQIGRAKGSETGLGVKACTDSGTTHINLIKKIHIPLKVSDFLLKVGGVCVELLTGGHRDGVLKLGTAHLDYILEFLAFGLERTDQIL